VHLLLIASRLLNQALPTFGALFVSNQDEYDWLLKTTAATNRTMKNTSSAVYENETWAEPV